MTTADLLRAIQHRTALCRELWITPVTLYRCVGPQGQVREQGEKIRSSPLNRSAWTVIPLGTFWKQAVHNRLGPRPCVANDRLRHTLIDKSRLS